MKKILALAMAALMTAGMTTVAFAKNEETPSFKENGDALLFVMDDGEVSTDSKLTGEYVEGGDEIAIPVALYSTKTNYNWYTIDSEFDKKLVVDEDWDVNEADTEFRFVKYAKGVLNENKALRVYSLVITVPENDGDKVIDLMGTVAVGKTISEAKDADRVDVSVSIAPAAKDVTKFENAIFDAGKTGIVSFADEEGEIDIEFGDQAMFTVDVTGQGKLNLTWNTTFDKEFAAKYDYANLDFINFEGEPSFNKTGDFYIFADEDAFIYRKGAEGVEAVNAEWDEDMDAWRIRTRKLDSFVISDVELDEQTVTEDKDESSSTTDDGKVNPGPWR